MRVVVIPVLAAALLTFCAPRDQQAGDNQQRTDETGMAGGGGIETAGDTMSAAAADTMAAATTPSGILSQMNVTNTAEIQHSRVASEKASSPAVKKIADQLVADHSKNREQVRALAQKLDVPLTPAAGGDITPRDSIGLPPDLQGKSGAEFDRAFIQHQIREHGSNIEKIQSQMLPAAQDPQVKIYLQNTLAEMQKHLASLREVEQQLGA